MQTLRFPSCEVLIATDAWRPQVKWAWVCARWTSALPRPPPILGAEINSDPDGFSSFRGATYRACAVGVGPKPAREELFARRIGGAALRRIHIADRRPIGLGGVRGTFLFFFCFFCRATRLAFNGPPTRRGFPEICGVGRPGIPAQRRYGPCCGTSMRRRPPTIQVATQFA